MGTGRDRTSQASDTESLDLRRLSTRADSAYSSFSTASGGPETRTPSPGTERLPYLDWDYVRVVWGNRSPISKDAVPSMTQGPGPAVVAGHSDPRPPEVQGNAGPLSRQDTPLLYALTAEAEATTRTAEPPSPPASRAAYRQRLQGAQRRVLRETSFQRKELRMSLPGRLRPALPARPPTGHVRSASSSQELGEAEPARAAVPALGAAGRGHLASQQRLCCFSEPGKLHRVGWSGGPTGEGLREAYSTQELQRGMHAKSKGLQETQSLSSTELNSRSANLASAHRPAGRSQSVSGCTGSERTVATVQVWKIKDVGGGGGRHLGDYVSGRCFPVLGCSSKSRHPQTTASDQAFQVRDLGHFGDKVSTFTGLPLKGDHGSCIYYFPYIETKFLRKGT